MCLVFHLSNAIKRMLIHWCGKVAWVQFQMVIASNDRTPYQVPKIYWNDYEVDTRTVVDAVVRELVAYHDFYWTV